MSKTASRPRAHICAWAKCRRGVPWREGDRPSKYKIRKYCDEHRDAAKAPPPAAWRSEQRLCAGPDCTVVFSPVDYRQRHHDPKCKHASAGLTRRGEVETKPCKCGCGDRFDRPTNLGQAQWDGRQFASMAHFYAWKSGKVYRRPDASERSPLAIRGEGGPMPGAARAGNRKAPKIPGAKKPRAAGSAPKPAPKPTGRHIFPEGPRTEPFRPGRMPTVEPIVRTEKRPSFGLSKRRAG